MGDVDGGSMGGFMGGGGLGLLGAGISAAGSIAGSLINQSTVNSTNAANAALASSNTAFQERMANTAHQREMADLKAAGLNPIMAAGGGAAVPTGSVARMDPGDTGGMVAEGVRGAASTALSGVQMDKQLANLDADTANKVTEGFNKLEGNKLIQEQIKDQQLTNARNQVLNGEILKQAGYATESKRISTAKEAAELPYYEQRAKLDRENAEFDKRVDQISGTLDAITSGLNLHNMFKSRPGSVHHENKMMNRAGPRGIRVR